MLVPNACRAQTAHEEIANALSHGAGAIVAAVFTPQLIGNALHAGTHTALAAAVYAVSMILLYSMSATYHWLPEGAAKEIFRRLDHAAIFIFIAGSATPFMLRLAQDGSYAMLAMLWLAATAGAAAKCANRLNHPLLSTGLYLLLGWVAVFVLGPVVRAIPPQGLSLIVAGGVLYTLGAIVFLVDHRFRFAHFVWHLLVLGASGCHFVAVMRYALA
ncbi:MAG TPA: hemolysin III family protein [Ramlibacter sp.]|uniref:PAQR family membrane homeostasis protein TrhA n=1 Tax=Ramlibacter sp. TaxID=1917967 RepID=UPI002B5B2289|nr:hemolysin III family protein [Ramlibacter sp.]HVZ42609.1 hemolysin III family protein [Ramlibacter sp.]